MNQPSSAAWLQRFRSVHPPAACRDHDPKFGIVFSHGLGPRLWDVDGQEYFDLTCGYSAANFGHAFPPLIAIAERQLRQLTHVTGEPHVGRIELAEQLIEALGFPAERTKVMFNTGGARAVETAWKAAVAFRPGKLLTLGPCFHGRSLATHTLGDPPHGVLHSIAPEHSTHFASDAYPYCAACPLGLRYPDCELQCVAPLFQHLEQHAAQISAVLVEPAIGARGYIFPPAEFLSRLRSITAAKGMLMIADEIQTGLGRCGAWLLSRQQGWEPDLVVIGKSLGGGMVPISAVVGRADVLDSLPSGSESETFAASPLAAALGLGVLQQLRTEDWMQHGARVGAQLRQFFAEEFASRVGGPLFVEGQGASCAIEFATPRLQPATQSVQRARQLADALLRQRLLVHLTGPHATRVVLLPPLNLSEEDLAHIIDRLRNLR